MEQAEGASRHHPCLDATINFDDLFNFSPPEPVGNNNANFVDDDDEGGASDDEPAPTTPTFGRSSTASSAAVSSSYTPITVQQPRLLALASPSEQDSSLSRSAPVAAYCHWAAGARDGDDLPPASLSAESVVSKEEEGDILSLLASSSVPADVGANSTPPSKPKGKRGRKPGQRNANSTSSDASTMKSKLERSRQSARECRARKKLRYQYLDDIILEREKANVALREELLQLQAWCHELDEGRIPDGLADMLAAEDMGRQQQQQAASSSSGV